MATSSNDNLLADFLRSSNGPRSDAVDTPVVTRPSVNATPADANNDAQLESLLSRIRAISSSNSAPNSASAASSTAAFPTANVPSSSSAPFAGSNPEPAWNVTPQHANGNHAWYPHEPVSMAATGLSEGAIESLTLKYLLMHGEATGREIADQVKLAFILIDPMLRQMKFDQLLAYRGSAPMNDYVYQLTDLGRDRARRESELCTYCGAAPVPLRDYVASIKSQSLEHQHPSPDQLREAFQDLLLSPSMFNRLGPAIKSGRGMFLYGGPGNGKTSIAERVTRAFGQCVWIPRCLDVEGEILRVFDPMVHVECPLEKGEGLLDQSKIDRRWVRIHRPTIIVGGELTMENLEVYSNPRSGICESPVQMKSNCGTLVIDDFGRQRMRTDELLNRWIVPLEKRFDFLNMPSGKKIQVPFDQFIIFSTNLQPKELVDEAFLRRIPYKIEVPNPTEVEFRQLMRTVSGKMGIAYCESAVNYLIEKHYTAANRSFRCCQPRDLLLQVRNHCQFLQLPLEMTAENFDFAVENYFAVME